MPKSLWQNGCSITICGIASTVCSTHAIVMPPLLNLTEKINKQLDWKRSTQISRKSFVSCRTIQTYQVHCPKTEVKMFRADALEAFLQLDVCLWNQWWDLQSMDHGVDHVSVSLQRKTNPKMWTFDRATFLCKIETMKLDALQDWTWYLLCKLFHLKSSKHTHAHISYDFKSIQVVKTDKMHKYNRIFT